jgi:hypothetical protein
MRSARRDAGGVDTLTVRLAEEDPPRRLSLALQARWRHARAIVRPRLVAHNPRKAATATGRTDLHCEEGVPWKAAFGCRRAGKPAAKRSLEEE